MTITAAACPAHPGAVDLLDDRYPGDEVLHFSAAEWVEFLAAVKGGKFDGVAVQAVGISGGARSEAESQAGLRGAGTGHGRTLNGGSPEELAEYLAEAVAR